MANILPPSASDQERALAAISERFDNLNTDLRALWNPDTCPVSFLPYLAWTFSLDDWDDNWPETIKRQRIKDSLYNHRIKGSRQSLENAVAAFNAQLLITEWWEKTPKGTPHTFEVFLNAAQNDRLANVLADLEGMQWVFCGEPIPVNTARMYRVRFRVRQIRDDALNKVYAGVATLDKDYLPISGGSGTHRYCAASAESITVTDGWQTFEGTISGTGDNQDQFRPGTVFVRPMFIVNYQETGVAQVAELSITDLFENRQLVPNPEFADGKTGWSLSHAGETVPDNAPGTITQASFGLTANLQTDIINAINQVKPVRSHFTVSTGVAATGNLYLSGIARLLNFVRLDMEAQ